MNAPATSAHAVDSTTDSLSRTPRIVSIDALRGLIVFMMIFVNDLAGAPHELVPAWMKHFEGKSGMTFVDLVFPAFLFIVGMSIPFALGSRLNKGEALWKTALHALVRTLSLLMIGIMMVNEYPSSEKMGWSATVWVVLMYFSAFLAFSALSLPKDVKCSERGARLFRMASVALRVGGFLGLIWLALAFRGDKGQRILTLSPFSIHTSWYGILGLIGWAYGVGAAVFLVFRLERTALLGCMALLLCLYPAGRTGFFDGFWLERYVGIGETLGSLPSITVAGLLLATVVLGREKDDFRARLRFTGWFVAGCCVGAMLLKGLYGISKNNATPAWCLWSCAITAALWLVFHWASDVRPMKFVSKPFSVAGQNVLLAYLISEMLPALLDLLHLGDAYGRLAEGQLAFAVARSACCAALILALTAGLNRLGFRLRI